MTERVVIGIDCATVSKKVGLACGISRAGGVTIEEVRCGGPGTIDTIAQWIGGSDALLALDAPLGWPGSMGTALAGHQAGRALDSAITFDRETDRVVYRIIGKKPLDVGADRIARTAAAALTLLEQLRQRLGREIPLAWSRDTLHAAAIEVYPAATLRAHGIPSADYKRKTQTMQRSLILDRLGELVDFHAGIPRAITNADQLDAVVCVLAGHDFQHGPVLQPDDVGLAEKEGWIWVRGPSPFGRELA